MNLSGAVDNNWGIGYKGNLLFTIPEDMKHFKKLTENKVVIMGYATLKSLPKSKPLKNRVNIILSRNDELIIDNVTVCNSIVQLMETIECYNSDDVFVIGGQMVYQQLINYCSVAYVTKVKSQKKADKYFPNIDYMDNWVNIFETEEKRYGDLMYTFSIYVNRNNCHSLSYKKAALLEPYL